MKTLKLSIFYIFLLSIISCNTENIELSKEQQIEHEAKSYVVFGTTPGVIVGTYKNGEIKTYSFGVANLETGAKIDANTIFEIGSITKTFTANLIAQEVLNGNLNLQTEANIYLPDFFQLPSKDGIEIQLKHLLNHTSGLNREPENLDVNQPYNYSNDQMSAYLSTTQLQTQPGTKFSYSNTGMGLAGYLVAHHQNTTYADLVKNMIFTPLQMNQSFCNLSELPSTNVAQGYMGNVPKPYFVMSEVFAGAGYIKSNMHDMLIYLQNQINVENSVLEDAIGLTLIPTFEDSEKVKLCLGWVEAIDDANNKIYLHDGGTYGFSSFIGFNREKKYGVIVLMNAFATNGEQVLLGAEVLKILDSD